MCYQNTTNVAPLFGKNGFVYDAEKDLYDCPQGETLRRQGLDYKERPIRYAARLSACNPCPLKTCCTKSKKPEFSREKRPSRGDDPRRDDYQGDGDGYR